MSIAARSPSDAEDRIDALLAELDADRPYRTSFQELQLYATADFDRVEEREESSVLDGDTGVMCPSCVDEIADHGIEDVLTSWHRKDPYCTTLSDVDEMPAQFRDDKSVKQEKYVGVLCPDHPKVFIAYAADGYR